LAPPQTQRRCVTCVLLTAVFISGLLAGGGLTIILGLGQRPRKPRAMEEVRDELTEKFTERLGLSEAQIPKVRDVVEARILDHFRQRDRQLSLMDKHIRAILNDEQAAKWKKLYAELLEKYSKNRTATQPAEQ